ncbi:hypothetical protein CR201_G0052590, partial [Pongo abelii]
VAFLVAFHQNKQLIGDRGLLPCRVFLKNFQHYFQDRTSWEVFSYRPTILWLMDWSDMNANLDLLALLGLGISSFILITGCANMLLMAALWGLYLSLVNVGHVWYSFGWDSQLLETGFLGIFLCPLWRLSRLPQHTPTSRIVLWGFRWLIFRIMLGAGLIKIQGDRCWRDLTCMDFHYETQPVPNPVAYYLHHSPWWLHRFETLSNHFIELLVPSSSSSAGGRASSTGCCRSCSSITRERIEVILQGTASANASAPDAVWEDYEFKCKPGDPSRRPCLMSPYHYRLDWLMCFAAFQTYEQNDWILHLAGKLLASDPEALSLLAHNPFAGRPPP